MTLRPPLPGIGGPDLAEPADLTHTVAAHPPALAAGRIEI